MPKNQPKGKPKPVLRQVMEKAAAVDRRRRAQIENQGQAINRLLEAMNNHTPFQKAVTDEMAVLHQGAAELRAQRDEAREALKALADACAQTLPGSAWSDDIDAAVQAATQIIGPMAVSDAVSSSGARAG